MKNSKENLTLLKARLGREEKILKDKEVEIKTVESHFQE